MHGPAVLWRRLGLAIALLAVVVAIARIGVAARRDTMADPIVRRTAVALPGMPQGSAPVTIALLADFHPAQPDMPISRLSRIVDQANRLRPDVIVLAGDYVTDPGFDLRPYSVSASIAPLAKLRAPLGVYAVLGNHDYRDPQAVVARELTRRGITVLANQTARAGPLLVYGVDFWHRRQKELAQPLAAMRRLGGGRVIVSHTPDPFSFLPPDTGLMLAGHTHCGQIRIFGWAPVTNSYKGHLYGCGEVRERGNVLIVTAGLGTSFVPVRLGAVPDIWLVTVRPQGRPLLRAE